VSTKSFIAVENAVWKENVLDPIAVLLEYFSETLNIPVRGYHYFETDDNKAMVSIFTKSRFCQIVNGSHAKNQVYYVCDLINNLYYVKCFNDECKGDRASPITVFVE
jgi:hypothetical protein